MYGIIKEPKNNSYREFIKYALKKSDVIMFVIRRDRYTECSKYNVIKNICNILNIEEKEYELHYKDYIDKEYDKIYEKIDTFFKWGLEYLNFLKKEGKKAEEEFIKLYLKNNTKRIIKGKEDLLIQEKCMNEIKEKLNKYLIKERHNPEWVVNKVMKEEDEWKNDGEYLYDICFYKVCPEIEEILLNKVDSLYAFDPPYLPEDICFYKDGYCWLGTLTHEEWAFIYIDNKEDYNYLKKIGIKLKKYSDENNKNEKNYEDGIAY